MRKLSKVRALSESVGWNIDMIKALDVSDAHISNRKMCILSTGYDLGHEDLPVGDKVSGGQDSSSPEPWFEDVSEQSHGTFNAGLISAIGNNNKGVVGTVRNGEMSIHVEKFLHSNSGLITSATFMACLNNCVSNGTNIIAMPFVRSHDTAVEAHIESLYDNENILFTGEAYRGFYPGSSDSVMAVAAIRESKESLIGEPIDMRKADISAPGGATIISTTKMNSYGNSYAFFASSHVAGVAALVWSHFPNATNKEIRTCLEMSAEDIGPAGKDDEFGHGIVRADFALQYCADIFNAPTGTPKQPSTSPTTFFPSPNPSDEPSIAPINTIAPTSCEEICAVPEESHFVFFHKYGTDSNGDTISKTKTCGWLAKKTKFKQNQFCYSTATDGVYDAARDVCTTTCCRCPCTSAPSDVPSPGPSISQLPSVTPTDSPSIVPTQVPSSTPSDIPTDLPSLSPSKSPSDVPSMMPSSMPTSSPSDIPSDVPSMMPSSMPTSTPTSTPSAKPSVLPSAKPSFKPSFVPSSLPSVTPSVAPSNDPSASPSASPSATPSFVPSLKPSSSPSVAPSSLPSSSPSSVPSFLPSLVPTISSAPTEYCINCDDFTFGQDYYNPGKEKDCDWIALTGNYDKCNEVYDGRLIRSCCRLTCEYACGAPTAAPSLSPSATPSALPSSLPSVYPSSAPSSTPSVSPTSSPFAKPSGAPSFDPSSSPSLLPSSSPSSKPSKMPSALPTVTPSSSPSSAPSTYPSVAPSLEPTSMPSVTPTSIPSTYPTTSPSASPSSVPSISFLPSSTPSVLPTLFPSQSPSSCTEICAIPETDDLDFWYEDKKGNAKVKSCGWLAKKSKNRINNICFNSAGNDALTIDDHTYLPVFDVCTTSCCRCPCTHEPSISPSGGSPSSAPTDKCVDDDEYAYGSNYYIAHDYKSCAWIRENKEFGDCDEVFDGILVGSKCRNTCHPDCQTESPSTSPSSTPTTSPTAVPSKLPSLKPSATPTFSPSMAPSSVPSVKPSYSPSVRPSVSPSASPSYSPSNSPSTTPSDAPSEIPSNIPTTTPSEVPSVSPSDIPSAGPSACVDDEFFHFGDSYYAPGLIRTCSWISETNSYEKCDDIYSGKAISAKCRRTCICERPTPTSSPSVTPSNVPSMSPTGIPSQSPSSNPSDSPSESPSDIPSDSPSQSPSEIPSESPSFSPSDSPSVSPTDVPTDSPSDSPSESPSDIPSDIPSKSPSDSPTDSPSMNPSDGPSDIPTDSPTDSPSDIPSISPTDSPTKAPTPSPSASPTVSAKPTKDFTPAPTPVCYDLSGRFYVSETGTFYKCKRAGLNAHLCDYPEFKTNCPITCKTCGST